MECRIDPKLPYVDLPAMIRRQRQVSHVFLLEVVAFCILYGCWEIWFIEVEKHVFLMPQS
jgi:hypothetical protein